MGLTLAVPPLALLGAAAVYCAKLNRVLLANLSPILAAEVTRQTGHETRLGRVRYSTPGVLTVDDVAVASRSTFAQSHGEAVLRADRLTVHYDPRALLLDTGNAAHALGDVVLVRPTVLVERLSKTQFNFSDILKKPKKGAQKPFDGQVIVRDGLLRFRDYLAPARLHTQPALNALANVGVTVNLHSEQTAYFVGAGQGTAGRLATFHVSGDASRQIAGRFRAAVQATDADAAYWAAYFASTPGVRVTAGRVDLDLTASRLGQKPPPGLPVDLLGRVTVRRAALAFAGPPLRRLSLSALTGSATFTGAGLSFDAMVAANGQTVAGSGTLFDFQHPQLAATLTSASLDAERLARTFPTVRWPAGLSVAPGSATVGVVGPSTGPTISATVLVPAVQYAGNRVTGVRANAVFAGRTLTVSSLTLRLPGGGQAALRGTVVLAGRTPTVRVAVQARGVRLAALHLPAGAGRGLNLGGLADAQVLADNAVHPLRVIANVAIARPRLSKTQLVSARARLTYVQGQGLTLSRALVRAAQGAFLASGTIPMGGPAGQWNLNVDAAGLNLSSLAGPYTSAPVGGVFYFRGRVLGPRAAPRADGQVQLINPRYARFTADVVRGGVAASADGLRLDGLTLNLFPAEARVSGTVTRLASRNPALDLSVRLSRADVQDFVDIAGQFAPAPKRTAVLPPITGTAQGTFQVAGTVRAPRVAGQASVTGATVGPYRVDDLRVRAAYGGGAVRVADVTVHAEGATLSARGALGLRAGSLQAVFTGTDIDLERFRDLSNPYADLDGILGVSGRVGGTLKNPSGSAALTGRGVNVDGQALAPLTLAGRYADGVFTKTGAPTTLDILASGPAAPDIRYVISSLRLSLPTPLHPRRAPSIALDAALPADAPERVPHLIQTLRNSRFAATPAGRRLLTRIDTLPRPLDGAISIPRLTLRGPLAGPDVQATVRATGLALGPDRLGSLTADLGFADPHNPSARASLTATDLFAAGVPVASVTANATLANHVVTLSALRATSQRGFLEASGTADLNGAVNASLDASNIPLSLLDPFLPQTAAQTRSLTGELSSLSVSASGPTRNPDLTASVNLANPGLALAPPGGPAKTAYALDRIRSGTITLTKPTPGAAQVLAITDLAAFKNGHPVASLSGTLPFRWRGEDTALPGLPDGQPLHAQLLVPDLSLLAPFLPALDPKKTGGTLTAGLDVTSLDTLAGGEVLRVGGTLDLTGGALGLAGFDTALTKLTAHVGLADGRITIRQFSAASSRGGSLALTGGGTLDQANLRLTATNLAVNEAGRQGLLKTYGTALRAKINGSLGIVGPWKTPLVSTLAGEPLRVTDAAGSLPGGQAVAGGPGGPPPIDPRFDIALLLGTPNKTVTVSNALIRADGSGDVALAGRLTAPRLRAHFSVARGQLVLPPATRLRFVRSFEGNTVNVRYPEPDPAAGGLPGLQTRVNLTAQATVSLSQAQLAAYRPGVSETGVGGGAAPVGNTATTASGFNQPQRYTITAHIHGALNDPALKIDLESSPGGLSQQQMLVALTGAPGLLALTGPNAQAAFQQEVANALYSVGVPALLTPLEDSVAQSFGLSEFDVAYAPDSPLLVTLSKQLAPRVEITYFRSIGARTNSVSSLGQPPQYTLKLGYGLTRRLQVSVSTDDQRNNTLALEGVLGF